MVKIRDLPQKPLVEAILEIRWDVDPEKGDPNYSIFVGSLYNFLASKYPYHEQLPSSMMPSQIATNIVQHRFRVTEGKWPLVQVGPGIVTLNDTDNYTWRDFSIRARYIVNSIYRAYPKPDELTVTSLVLRYIDADNHDYINEDSFDYLKDKMKVNIALPQQLLRKQGVQKLPKGLNFQVSFPTVKPRGAITLKLATGQHKGENSIVWETIVRSAGDDLPAIPENFNAWLSSAHSLTDYWFFTLIEGELERKFAGED